MGKRILKLSDRSQVRSEDFIMFELEGGGQVSIPPDQVERMWNREQVRHAAGKTGDSDLRELARARPWLRSAVALAIYLRVGENDGAIVDPVEGCYARADRFLSTVEADMKADPDAS